MREPTFLCLLLVFTAGQACSTATKFQYDLGEAAAVVTRAAAAVPASAKLSFVDLSDPNGAALEAEEARLRQRFSTGSVALDKVSWRQIRGEALAELFPNDRFYVYVYDWHVRKGFAPGSLVSPSHRLFVVDRAGRGRRIEAYGNYEEFGAFLHERRVTIRDEADAKRVWSAFCQLHLKCWSRYGLQKAGDDEWHLGISRGDRHQYWYEVLLNSDGTVAAARLRHQ